MIKNILLIILLIFFLLNITKIGCNREGSIAEKINFASKTCLK